MFLIISLKLSTRTQEVFCLATDEKKDSSSTAGSALQAGPVCWGSLTPVVLDTHLTDIRPA